MAPPVDGGEVAVGREHPEALDRDPALVLEQRRLAGRHRAPSSNDGGHDRRRSGRARREVVGTDRERIGVAGLVPVRRPELLRQGAAGDGQEQAAVDAAADAPALAELCVEDALLTVARHNH
nr:hypothetical protein [Tetrasphaera sp. HKS02]